MAEVGGLERCSGHCFALRFCKRTHARCSCRVMERLNDALAAGCTWPWLFRCCVECMAD